MTRGKQGRLFGPIELSKPRSKLSGGHGASDGLERVKRRRIETELESV